MKLLMLALSLTLLNGCFSKESKEPVVAVEEVKPAGPQAQRIPAAEEAFLKNVKSHIAKKDTDSLISMGYWEGASEAYKGSIPYIYKNLTKFENPEVFIEESGYSHSKTTVPMVGQLVVKKDGGYTKVPVGVKDGKYYFTMMAQ